jgi:acetoin utilization deacetylase AcuC-like enzyme
VPILDRFQPDIVIVSAGQDILTDDPAGIMRIEPEDFLFLTGALLDATSLPLALVLEGGYGSSHPEAIRNIFSALGGNRYTREISPPSRTTRDLVSVLRKLHHLPYS